ncbi:hypothetical protein J120_04845 [candidate division TM6 bacterium JCVI TM6SC1]|uniref:Uncharacterized protein n=1 Tax=candidate division TM6 bacterium JCVI TM6SC1 TaxID=1306947 RepID=A0A0D2I0Z6_9BACT|nr:hypothetical protein J120_04845 [candidate division TM6 bacterium JCVI TM6SC1]
MKYLLIILLSYTTTGMLCLNAAQQEHPQRIRVMIDDNDDLIISTPCTTSLGNIISYIITGGSFISTGYLIAPFSLVGTSILTGFTDRETIAISTSFTLLVAGIVSYAVRAYTKPDTYDQNHEE